MGGGAKALAPVKKAARSARMHVVAAGIRQRAIVVGREDEDAEVDVSVAQSEAGRALRLFSLYVGTRGFTTRRTANRAYGNMPFRGRALSPSMVWYVPTAL